MNWTPGPWRIEKLRSPIYGSDGSLMAEWYAVSSPYSSRPIAHIMTSENAHLVAAAPDLAEACEAFIDAIEGYERRTGILHLHPCVNQARAALTKAKEG